MTYEIIHLQEKQIIGISTRMNNMDPEIGQMIGGMWKSYFEDGYYAQTNFKKNNQTLGIYTDYAGNEKDDYTLLVGCEVTDSSKYPQGTEQRIIPGGTYAKFTLTGDKQQEVARFWMELWKMNLPRSFKYDFEEYLNINDEQAEIHIYIGIEG